MKCKGQDVAGVDQCSCRGSLVWTSGNGFANLYVWEGAFGKTSVS